MKEDVTERKKMEQELLRAQRMESIGALAGGVAHDLNNILAPIMMAASMLHDELSKETHNQFVSTIEDAVRNADLVLDCVPDELESKLEILWLLDRMAPPHCVFATPTTRLSITDLANCTYRPEKCIAIATEASALAANLNTEILLRTTPVTAAETTALVGDFWRRLGFTPSFEPEATSA